MSHLPSGSSIPWCLLMVVVAEFKSALPRVVNVTAGPFSGFSWKASALLEKTFGTDYGQLVLLKTVEFEVHMY